MKGWLGHDKWRVSEMYPRFYIAERIVDGNLEHHELGAHCLACAKMEILVKYGGKVDNRGWHKQGDCGVFLRFVGPEMEELDEEFNR